MFGRKAEILGLDEIVGEWDQAEMVGAGPLALSRGFAGPGGNTVGRVPYGQQRYQKGRELPLPLSTTVAVAANTNGVQVTAQPQTLFRPERWIISDPTPSFTVSDLRIGKNSVFVAPGTIPTAAFGPNAFGARLRMDTAQISMIITAVVNNITAAAAQFVSVLMGASIE